MKLPPANRISSCLVGGLMVAAAVLKFHHPLSLLREVGTYPFLPDVARYLAWVVPPFELLVGAGLLSRRWTGACWLGVVLMMGVFTPALVYAWSTDLYLACSCFGDAFKMPLPWAVVRNGILFGVAVWQYSLRAQKKPAGEGGLFSADSD